MDQRRPNLLDDSSYARELARGDHLRPFAPAVEAEYQLVHLRGARLRVRIWFAVLVLQVVPVTAREVYMHGLADLGALVLLFVCLPCALVPAWLCWTRHYELWYARVARFAVPAQFWPVGYFVARDMGQLGQHQELAILLFLITGIMFLSGLPSRTAILSSALMIASFVLAGVQFAIPSAPMAMSLSLLAMSFGVSSLVARDIERAQRRSFLEGALISELIDRDPLTGLRNRRAFDERLRQLWQQALRDRRTVALLMVDVDGFKQYNDAHGHPAGDALLRGVATQIQNAARRPLDIAARYGGDEFALILYDVGGETMRSMAEQIRAGVEALPACNPEVRSSPRVSVSIGAASVRPTRIGSPESGLRIADAALYEAKRAGRNCVVIESAVDASGIHRLAG